jgi:predicted ATP-grasp superfamily ATP-dependent carboligase
MPLGNGRRVLVTDGHSTAALATVRSLGRHHFRVTSACDASRVNAAGHSRYCDRSVQMVSATREPAAFADQLAHELGDGRYDLLIPITDASAVIVTSERSRFDALCQVALPSPDVMSMAFDKAATAAAAAAVGMSVPITHTFDTLDDLDRDSEHLSLPCVIKPRFSRRFDGQGSVAGTLVRYAQTPQQLREAFRQVHAVSAWPLVQSFVEGSGTGVFVLAKRGEVVATFAHRRLREVSPTGGAASLAESISPDPRLVLPAVRLIESLKWHGVAMVEMKDPGPPHPPVLMEINGRLWGSLPLAIAAGMDFPALLAELFLDGRVAPPRNYQVGVRCRHLRGDLSHMVGVMKGAPVGWPGDFPSRASLIGAMMPWPGRWRPYNFWVTDPMPALMEAWGFLAAELRRGRSLTSHSRGDVQTRTRRVPSASEEGVAVSRPKS